MTIAADPILWLDLETTGSSPDSRILEIGIALTNHNLDILERPAPIDNHWNLDEGTTETATFQATVRTLVTNIWDLDPTVIEMHAASGLWRDIINDDPRTSYHDNEPELAMLDSDIQRWLNSWHESTKHIPLAGSGVSHFDRQFIRRDLPKLDKRLTYWAYDVGVIRRTLKLWGLATPDPAHDLSHRALDDVHDHIAEYRSYREYLQELAS